MPSKRDPLSLAGGQGGASLANPGLIACGQPDDQIVHPGRLSRRHNSLRRCFRA